MRRRIDEQRGIYERIGISFDGYRERQPVIIWNYQKYDDLDMPPVSLKNQLEESAPEELTLTKALKLYQGVKR